MKKSYKIIWGILTPAPIILIILGVVCLVMFIAHNIPAKGTVPTPPMPADIIGGIFGFYGLLLLGIFLGFLIHISYFIHLVRKEDMTKDMKTMWVILFMVLNVLSMIVYWFMVVLPEPEPKLVSGNPGLIPVKKMKKK